MRWFTLQKGRHMRFRFVAVTAVVTFAIAAGATPLAARDAVTPKASGAG